MQLETATFGAGCFWCIEAVFQQLEGVHEVVSGYTGGTTANPDYRTICTGTTGHAEVVQIRFQPDVISYTELLDVFWHTHDPTTLNRQGGDHGTQYRSAIFYHNDEQLKIARQSKADMDNTELWDNPIVTEITPMETFYPAEDYHQNYFKNNPRQPYCQFVIQPKMQKFTADFKHKLRTDAPADAPTDTPATDITTEQQEFYDLWLESVLEQDIAYHEKLETRSKIQQGIFNMLRTPESERTEAQQDIFELWVDIALGQDIAYYNGLETRSEILEEILDALQAVQAARLAEFLSESAQQPTPTEEPTGTTEEPETPNE